MRLDDAFFVYFSFLWYCLPSIVSHLVVYAFFFFPTSCFYLQGQSIFIRRISLQPALCSHLQCLPFYFCTKPQIYALAAGAQCSVAPMHVTQRNHQTDAVVPVTHYIRPSPKTLTFHFSPSIVTRLESFHRENQRLCSMSVMAS